MNPKDEGDDERYEFTPRDGMQGKPVSMFDIVERVLAEAGLELENLREVFLNPTNPDQSEIRKRVHAVLQKFSNSEAHRLQGELMNHVQDLMMAGAISGTTPSLALCGRLGQVTMDGKMTTSKKSLAGIGVILIAKMNDEDMRMYLEYTKQFIRDLKDPGSRIEITGIEDWKKEEPPNE